MSAAEGSVLATGAAAAEAAVAANSPGPAPGGRPWPVTRADHVVRGGGRMIGGDGLAEAGAT